MPWMEQAFTLNWRLQKQSRLALMISPQCSKRRGGRDNASTNGVGKAMLTETSE